MIYSITQRFAKRSVAFGGDGLDLSMPCRHSPEEVRIKRYSRHEFFLSVDGVDLKEEERKWRERTEDAKNQKTE